MKITIKRLDKSLPLPEYATDGSCAFDMYSRESATIEPKTIVALPSNLIIKTPPEHVLVLAPRSSLAKKKGLTLANGIGVIDQDYCGSEDEIHIQVYNFTDKSVIVERGERIAQGLFLKISRATWNETDKMDEKSRGGIGSTKGYTNQ